jgi:exodeoxyribonuclease VII small subunit
MSKRAATHKDQRPDPSEMTWEQAMAELEAINLQIEQGDIGLEDSLEAYKRGVSLTQRCHAILDTAEQELKKIKPGGKGAETP